MVKILDRYVFSEAFKILILSLVTFLTLFGIVDLVSHINLVMKIGLSKSLQFIVGRFPLYTVRVLPIAVLISTMVTLSSFSSTNELTVVRALGISIYRFSLPLFALAVISSAFSLFVQETLLPKGLKLTRSITEEHVKPEKLNGVWFQDKKRDFVFLWSFNLREKTGKWASLIKVKNFQPTERLDAEKVYYAGKGIWKFEQVLKRDLVNFKTVELPSLKLNLGVDVKDLKLSGMNPQQSGLFKLYVTIKRLKKIGYNTTEMEVELYSKLALALFPIVVTAIGIPFGVYNPRNRKGYTLAIASLIVVFMWVTTALFLSLGKSGVLPPLYAAFAPLMLFGALGLFLLGRVES